ncbi:MAG: hypothetical protein N2050_01780 [Flavobacteriales bacterium]|nr:hypothetical protein [Flavobacteriales bacterium]MCX7649268.1 hypothetical protein [Flavobacteriales bacterium]MDW8432121.1 hypothetical protein [Flavobacteriales bacterium]
MNFYNLHHFLLENLPREAFLFYVTWYLILTIFIKGGVFWAVGFSRPFCKALLPAVLSQMLNLGIFISWVFSDWPKPFGFEWMFAAWLGYSVILDFLVLALVKPKDAGTNSWILASVVGNVTAAAGLLLILMSVLARAI